MAGTKSIVKGRIQLRGGVVLICGSVMYETLLATVMYETGHHRSKAISDRYLTLNSHWGSF